MTPSLLHCMKELDFVWFIIALYLYISGDLLKILPSVELKMVTKSVFQVIPCTENGDNRKDVEKVEPSEVNLKKQQQQKQHFLLACFFVIFSKLLIYKIFQDLHQSMAH